MTRLALLSCLVIAVAAAGPSSFSAAAGAATTTARAAPAGHDWTQFGGDAERSSASDVPTGIDARNVASLQKQTVEIDGTVDASAIYLHGVQVRGGTHDTLFVTTTYGKTLAIDAADGKVLWEYTPPQYSSWAGSRQITNATPIADPGRQFVYAASPDGHVQKLAVSDGHALWSTAITKLPQREKIASPLNEFKGHIVAVTGGYIGDQPPYQGHVAILDANSGRILHVWNSLCSDRAELIDPKSCPESDSAIWGRAGAVIDSQTGHVFVATGNARWDGRTYWGDAVVELDQDATRMLANYTPQNTSELNERDADLGSTSPVLLDPRTIAQGGKDGQIRVLSLEKIAGTAPHQGGEQQTVSTPSGTDLFTAPAVWRTKGTTWMFAADNGGTAAWTFAGGRLSPKWHNDHSGTSPLVAGGLLYVYDQRGGGLRVYEPATGRQLAALACGEGHWNSPMVADGRIILPEGNANSHDMSGVLDIWRVSRQ
ncbi:MAG TPA: PQQ-binding-like beta-propeller repeat protein [Vicinamibacterales bacterium]|nr:PQQ-binding-like beta-propeller repeat protein [Vicinamibacterales bacterium]